MPLKIIGAGFGRTGTLSLHHALETLGYPCYHMFEVLDQKRNPGHLDFWRQVANGKAGQQFEWERVFGSYSAAVDNPACCVWRELMAAYPDAKVILSTHPRGAEAWYESTLDTIYFTEIRWQFKVLKIFTPFGRKFGDMVGKLIWQRAHRCTMNDRAAAIAHYHQHCKEVRAAVPEGKLLEFSVEQGWQPLCDFLGVPIPTDKSFPNVNDRTQIKRTIADISKGAYSILAILAAAAGALIYSIAS